MPHPVTIRRSLILGFGLVIVLLTAVLLGSTWFTARHAAQAQAGRLIERALEEVQRRGRAHFQPVERILLFAGAWREQAAFTEDEQLRQVFEALERASPQVADIRFEPRTAHAGLDFRTDPVRWTRPRALASSGELAMTALAQVDLPSGAQGIVAVDVPLEAISQFTMGSEVSKRSKVLTLLRRETAPAASGGPIYQVIGLPADPRFADAAARQEALMKPGRELGLRYLVDSLAPYTARGPARRGEPLRYESGGEMWWVGVREYQLDEDVHLMDVVFVPENDLLGDNATLRWLILAAAALALAVAMALAVAFARRAGAPIEALVAESERIRGGDFRAGRPIKSRIVEVRRLAEAQDEMRVGLEHLMRLEHDLQVARSIQQATFPSDMPTVAGYRLHGHSLPAEDTGGDTYDVIGVRRNPEPGDDKLTQGEADRAVLMLADATGHGIGPALSVSQVRAMLRMAVRLEADFVGVVREMNEQLCADLPPGRFISAWFGLLDPVDHTLTTFSAGQGPILIYRAAEDRFERFGGNAPPLGLMEITVELPPPTRLAPGDWYVVLSDGFHEALDADGEVFGEERIQDLLRTHAAEEPGALLAALHAAVDAYTAGAPPDDDRTCVIVKRV